ncbi:MAG: DUF4038 domain-containing protein [Phycisphaerae bacterium]|nr:DUF4038 domain-containing protein [Phycisphaerae bacterium]
MATRNLTVNRVNQWGLTSRRRRANPFAEVEVDAVITGPGRKAWRVPAFWGGGAKWLFRFAAPRPGAYAFRTECSDPADTGLHGREGRFTVVGYKGANPLYRHGRLRVAADRRHFEHADGRPFFWLGDTWWMGFTSRLRWPDETAALAADRAAKGFTVVQIVAGMQPDMDWMDRRGANEAGLPYDKGLDKVNPRWYDSADRKIDTIVDAGLAPCIVGCWGYYLMRLGVEKAKRHWRYLIARYGAYPVLWCLAGEATMPYYGLTLGAKADKEEADRHRAEQKAGWTEVARYVRGIDPFANPITVHPSQSGRDCVADDSVLDFNMLQTGHGGYGSIAGTRDVVRREYAHQPAMPVVQGEVNYEGILSGSRDDVQRATFWVCMLNGAAGFTYGANGIWQFNRPEKPYGPSPHGAAWGDRSWQEACKLPGSSVVALGKRLLQKYPWWKLQPMGESSAKPEAAERWDRGPQIAGIPGELIVAYYQQARAPWNSADFGRVTGLKPGGSYRARWIDPESGREYPLGKLVADSQGRWETPVAPIIGSMLLVVERVKRSHK